MIRADAVARLARGGLERMTETERAEQIEVMLLESWDAHPDWALVSSDVRTEFEGQHLVDSASSRRYDEVLLLWLRSRYAAATSDYLRAELNSFGVLVDTVEGGPESREACPCCGLRMLSTRGDYEICRVCWWEDDGQDGRDADVIRGGPNYGLSLTQGRANVILYGISDPAREDLRAVQDPANKYERGRVFVMSADGTTVQEPEAGWSSGAFQG